MWIKLQKCARYNVVKNITSKSSSVHIKFSQKKRSSWANPGWIKKKMSEGNLNSAAPLHLWSKIISKLNSCIFLRLLGAAIHSCSSSSGEECFHPIGFWFKSVSWEPTSALFKCPWARRRNPRKTFRWMFLCFCGTNMQKQINIHYFLIRFIKVLIPAEASVTRGHSAAGCCEIQLLLALCSPAYVTLQYLKPFDPQLSNFRKLPNSLIQSIY